MAKDHSEAIGFCGIALDAVSDVRDVMLVIKHFLTAEATELTAEERDACATVLRLGMEQAETAQTAINSGVAMMGGPRG